eukprot:scaffold1916_cov294-Prasinococcus_capsulatus_cf.AAC.4
MLSSRVDCELPSGFVYGMSHPTGLLSERVGCASEPWSGPWPRVQAELVRRAHCRGPAPSPGGAQCHWLSFANLAGRIRDTRRRSSLFPLEVTLSGGPFAASCTGNLGCMKMYHQLSEK